MGGIILFLYEAFKRKDVQYNKVKRQFLVLYDWMDLSRTGDKVLASLLHEKGYNKIIIYGWGYLGKQLYKDLQGSRIKVKGILDRGSVPNVYNIPTYSLRSELPEADVIIITVLYEGEKIKKDLSETVKCPIMSLEELI